MVDFDITLATFIAALAAVGGLIITGIIEAVKMHKNTKAKQVEFLQKLGEDLQKQMEKEDQLTTKRKCIGYAENYLNMVERVAFLYRTKRIPKDIASFFDVDIAQGLTVINWFDIKDIKDKGSTYAKNTWPEIAMYCEKFELNPADEKLPKGMIDYKSLPEE